MQFGHLVQKFHQCRSIQSVVLAQESEHSGEKKKHNHFGIYKKNQKLKETLIFVHQDSFY